MQRVWRTVTGFYHVCARGTGKQLIFEGDEDRWEFLELMRDCCREAGVTLTGAGATFPYGVDPADSNIRIAPSLPPVEELQQAIAVLCNSLKLAALEKMGL